MGGATSAAGEAYLHFPVDSLQNPDLHVYSSPHSNLTVMLSIYSEEKNKTYKQNHYGDSLVPTTSQSTQGKDLIFTDEQTPTAILPKAGGAQGKD